MIFSSYRVVELSDEPTTFCGYLFALVGAEMICAEPNEGSTVRSTFGREHIVRDCLSF